MPDQSFEVPPTEALFPPDDPLTISVPVIGDDGKVKMRKFLCLDRANPPLEGQDLSPSTFEATLVAALESNRIEARQMMKIAEGVGEARIAAEKGTLARVVKRPTRARPRSTR